MLHLFTILRDVLSIYANFLRAYYEESEDEVRWLNCDTEVLQRNIAKPSRPAVSTKLKLRML